LGWLEHLADACAGILVRADTRELLDTGYRVIVEDVADLLARISADLSVLER
jgi:hypothetical protein